MKHVNSTKKQAFFLALGLVAASPLSRFAEEQSEEGVVTGSIMKGAPLDSATNVSV